MHIISPFAYITAIFTLAKVLLQPRYDKTVRSETGGGGGGKKGKKKKQKKKKYLKFKKKKGF